MRRDAGYIGEPFKVGVAFKQESKCKTLLQSLNMDICISSLADLEFYLDLSWHRKDSVATNWMSLQPVAIKRESCAFQVYFES